MRMIPVLILVGCGGPASVVIGDGDPTTGPVGCGNGVVEQAEACDDGNALGGDGCTERCVVETGQLEVEPNDTWDAATPWDGGLAHGALPEGDVDCWELEAPACGAVAARLVAPCPPDVTLMVHDADGVGVAGGVLGPDGCPEVDPAVGWGAAYLRPGPASVCVASLLGGVVPSYAIEAEVLDDSTVLPADPGRDLDGDGAPDRCDDDRDGDGVSDALDNCPEIANGPNPVPLAPNLDGYLWAWLVLAPLPAGPTTGYCRPSDDEVLGVDADAAPEIGDPAGGLVWTTWFDTGNRIDFLDRYAYLAAPREVYSHVYVYSATQRDLTLALGADDGVFSWLNGAKLHDVASCQGANADQFQQPATLLAGWNRLTIKVRDNGGGWGMYARFLDIDGAPVTDLELSLTASGPWTSNQTDGDGDGIGDVCDDTP